MRRTDATDIGRRFRLALVLLGGVSLSAAGVGTHVAADDLSNRSDTFDERVQPILEDYCYACHGLGAKKGGVSFDGFTSAEERTNDHKLWLAVLKNTRAGLMPPPGEPRPGEQELRKLEDWIKSVSFAIDPANPDPGRVTVRRLNRVEYRNTIRDLLGVDYDTDSEFPADDSGHGFDNIGDVLTISPLLLEKYLDAAKSIVTRAVPAAARVPRETRYPGRRLRDLEGRPAGGGEGGPLALSYYTAATVSLSAPIEDAGAYQVVLDLTASERYVDGVSDLNRCRVTFQVDGKEVWSREFGRQDGKTFRPEFDVAWEPGDHELTLSIEPLTPGESQTRSLTIRVNALTIRGPMARAFWVRPADHAKFFPGEVPDDPELRRAYTRRLLGDFARRAFRRPVDDATVERLATLAERVSSQTESSYEAGVAEAMTAILASPRFLFREEGFLPSADGTYPLVDDYALASRLSYFLWSSMPDEELFRLASAGTLREHLDSQLKRMLGDPKAGELTRHFVGQWLQTRNVESVPINAFAVLARDAPRDPEGERRQNRFRELRRKEPEELSDAEKQELEELRGRFANSFRRFRDFELNGDVRRAMRRETEMLFERIVRENRSVLELIDSNYTYVNERLAKFYGIPDIQGDQMRLIELPQGSPRGGVLTQGTVLTVTSNPDRTSPVKRGLFILDNILGTPPPPPPPDIPPLEEAIRQFKDKPPTLRETLALHRQMPACASCHDRMDPMGLAFENFNALGIWRDQERDNPIDATGTLITGETFASVQELKRILVTQRRLDFYRCLSEKLLTYALGRGLEHHDVHTVDLLVAELERTQGSSASLLEGIVKSTPFQRTRVRGETPTALRTGSDPRASSR